MAKRIRVAQYGVGPIGQECLRTILEKEQTGLVELVGAIDIDPDKVGRDVGLLLGRDRTTGVVVRATAAEVLRDAKPDVVLHTTSSFLERVHDQLAECLRHGVHVVSSTEELSFPYARHPELSRQLDVLAREHGAVVVGTGVNPGFVMDTLALLSTGVCSEVSELHVQRVLDSGKRRLPLQRKIGAGLTLAEFEAKKATGTFGHIGLRESLLFVAKGLEWELDRIDETLDAMIADEEIVTSAAHINKGEVTGIHHAVSGYQGNRAVVSLDLKMYAGAKEPRDEIQVVGNPPINLIVRNGIFGDTATVAALVNMVPIVIDAEPGLRTMMDLPVPRAFATRPQLGRKAKAA